MITGAKQFNSPCFSMGIPPQRSFHVNAWNTMVPELWNGAATEAGAVPEGWFFFAVTLTDGETGKGKLRIVIDDKIHSRTSQIVATTSEQAVDMIGHNMNGAVIDELAVFQRALSDQEIMAIRALGLKGTAFGPSNLVPAAKAEKGAFVLLAAGKERKFDTLADAVQGAGAGDTIEIRGNGPFVTDGMDIRQSLVIRAGEGYIPSITLSQAAADKNVPLLNISASLVLEGLELRRMGRVIKTVPDREPFLLDAPHRESLHVANCRLVFKADPPAGDLGWPFNAHAKSLSVRNSVLSGNVDGASWRYGSGGRCTIENCVCAVGGIGFSNAEQDMTDVIMRVRGNTLVGNCLTLFTFGELDLPAGAATPPVRLEFSGNVARWDVSTRNKGFLYLGQVLVKEPVSGAQAEAFLPRLVGLEEKQNVYQTGTPMLRLLKGKRGEDLADWDRFWAQSNTGSVEGDIRFQGGDLVSRARSAPELITAEDFRLRPDSAGYRAGKDGKDLGADVDLVGPGPAYERWRKTPAYQQWLKDSGQVKK
jgi:hypothetical protein